jgi:co-chaperonin GroES (HSP10)
MKPIGKMVYIAEVQVEKTTAGGIILTNDSSLKETKFAKVLSVGDEVTKVKVGDKIVLNWSKCFPVKVDGTERALIEEENILAIDE